MSVHHERFGAMDFAAATDVLRSMTMQQRVGIIHWCKSKLTNPHFAFLLKEVFVAYSAVMEDDQKTALDVLFTWRKAARVMKLLQNDLPLNQILRLLGSMSYATTLVSFVLLRQFALIPQETRVDMLEFVGENCSEAAYLDFAALCKASAQMSSVFLTNLDEHYQSHKVVMGVEGAAKTLKWSAPHDADSSSAQTQNDPSPPQ